MQRTTASRQKEGVTMESLLIAGGFVAVYLLLQIYILPKMGIST